jgi:ribonuclease HII
MERDINWLKHENRLWRKGLRFIAGVDEAGRGPLAGPVVAAAVILAEGVDIPEVNDSKQMTSRAREEAFRQIMEKSLAVAVAASPVKVIDRVNILQATMLAMTLAVRRLRRQVDYVLVDGNRYPDNLSLSGEPIVDGDARCRSIAAASVIAKVTRDRLMRNLDRLYPQYGFSRNKGYATVEHIRAIQEFGPTPHHRFSFSPIRQNSLYFKDE